MGLAWMAVRAAAVAGVMIMAAAGASAGEIKWASAGDALTLDPHAQNEGPTFAMHRQIYEHLVQRDPNQKIEPGLATSWRAVDATTWRFKLREGVKFHDGTDFTADDVIFSLARAAHPNSDYKSLVADIVSVSALDATTVEIKTKGPAPLTPGNLTQIFIMSKSWAEAHDAIDVQKFAEKQENYAVRNANGTGPFKLDIREQDVRTRLVKNDAWWGLSAQAHNVDAILYRPVKNPATRVAALLSGEIDFLLDPPLQDVARLEKTPGLKVVRTAQLRTIFLGLDQGSKELRSSDIKGKNPFADKRVRLAVHQAIDIEAIKSKIMRGASVPAGIITAPGVHGHTPKLDERPPHSIEDAKRLLTEAGYPNGFSVKLDCPNDRYINDEPICQALVSMLAKVGIKVTLDSQPKALHFPKIENRKSDFYLFGWGVPTVDSEYVFDFLYKTGGEWNAIGYSNKDVDARIVGIKREVDYKKRDVLIAETWDLVKADIAYVPLHHQVLTWAMRDTVSLPIDNNDSPQFRYARTN